MTTNDTVCACQSEGREWSGSPNPTNPDNEWVCDDCNRVIPADEENGSVLTLESP